VCDGDRAQKYALDGVSADQHARSRRKDLCERGYARVDSATDLAQR